MLRSAERSRAQPNTHCRQRAMPSELFEDASVHAIMDATVAAFRGPRALQRCYWWVVIRCWLWVVIASLLAISSAGIGLSSRGKKWPLAPCVPSHGPNQYSAPSASLPICAAQDAGGHV